MLALFKSLMYKSTKFICLEIKVLEKIDEKGIHPDYHEITYVMTDGTEVKTKTTWGKAGDKMTLEIDPKSHPAWTGVHRMVDTGGQVSKFNSKFGAFGLKQDTSVSGSK